MYSLSRTGRTRTTDIWPGFVDGLASLLLVVIFVLMVFMVAQFFLSVALTGRDEQLIRLNQQIEQLSELLALERSANEELRENVDELSSQLQASLNRQDDLSSQLAAVTSERDVLKESLTGISQELEDAYKVIEADKETIEAQLQELAILKSLRDELQKDLAQAEATLAETEAARQQTLARAEEAETALAESEEARRQALARAEETETALAESEEARRLALQRAEDAEAALARMEDARLLALQRAEQAEEERDQALGRAEQAESARESTQEQLIQQENLTEAAQRRIDLLNRQILSLRQQLAKLNEALDAAEAKNERQRVQIADLGRRLNVALASRVQELARYRSEFFGRLREVLGDNPNIRIVGDRFVFQSELFFAQGEAELGADGREQLRQLAQTLKDVAARIPEDIDWILRVDGHTDRIPISTREFPSNWELSTARAVSVVKFLEAQGIPADRLAAAGFGEYQPLVTDDSLDSLRRNRRIEIKIDQQQ